MFFKRSLVRGVLATAAAALIAVSALGSTVHAQEPSVINLYSSGDTNITDWLQNDIIPAFEKAYPQYKVVFTNSRASGDDPIVARAIAALQTGSDPQVEVMDVDPRGFPDALKADLWYKPTEADIPNVKNIIKAAQVTDMAAAYRGSQVLIAYNSDKIKDEDVPKTFADLVTWIKANPGKFVYCRPDKGGSGGNFVVRALYEVADRNPDLFKGDMVDQKIVDEYYPKALALLKEIHPFIYEQGSYPAGNKPVLQLFAEGEVDMISAWSDQAIEGITKEQLPKSTKLVQFTDLPLPGSYTHLAIPKNAKNLKGAQDFVNWMLSPEGQTSVVSSIGGFPAIGWDQLPKDVQVQFNSVITDNVPLWPGGDWSAPLVKGWYEQVATNIDPNS
ncbi:MAG: extracellular solute-binding protein [Anaerolineae bacterium]|nr:extracellular solute-binding protein [Anaerolineae bacterium]